MQEQAVLRSNLSLVHSKMHDWDAAVESARQAVAADAEMPVGHFTGQLTRVRRQRIGQAIDINIVVASAVHFGEWDGHGGDRCNSSKVQSVHGRVRGWWSFNSLCLLATLPLVLTSTGQIQ